MLVTSRPGADVHRDSDADLMALTAAGQAGAFEELVRRHQQRVFNIVYRSVGNVTDAEDLVQDIFLRVFRAAPRYQPTAKFTTWLFRVATNAVINWLRKRDRRPVALSRVAPAGSTDSPDPVYEDPDASTGLHSLQTDELRTQVRAAIEALPPKQRLAVVLFRFEGRSYQEIAEALSCSVMAVKSLLSRARENLRRRLTPYLGEETGFSAEQGPEPPG